MASLLGGAMLVKYNFLRSILFFSTVILFGATTTGLQLNTSFVATAGFTRPRSK